MATNEGVIVIAMALAAVPGCSGDGPCPRGARHVQRALHDGRESFCEQTGVGRVGPYWFRSPTLEIEGSYVDGVRHGHWDWTALPVGSRAEKVGAIDDSFAPSGLPSMHRRYELGTIVSEGQALRGLPQGLTWRTYPKERDHDTAGEEIEYECGKKIRGRRWMVNGDIWANKERSYEPQRYAECMALLEKGRGKTPHPLMESPTLPPGRPPLDAPTVEENDEKRRRCKIHLDEPDCPPRSD